MRLSEAPSPSPSPPLGARWLAAGALVQLLAAGAWQPARAYYSEERFKALVYNDDSNDDAIGLDAQQLITRSGYSYELHHSIAEDGYVTQLIRLINPLADRKKLKRPPVMLLHGASLDQTAFLFASSRQHRPERYPRVATSPSVAGHGAGAPPSASEPAPITSSNRSLGFVLANNGYDVWLVGTRGSNEGNQGFVDNVTEARDRYADFTLSSSKHYKLIKQQRDRYFAYTLDEIVAHELREQMDRVLELSDADELSLVTFSLASASSMAFLAGEREYARRVRVYVQMGPAIAADHFTLASKLLWELLDPLQPSQGVGYLTALAPADGQRWLRRAILALGYRPSLRYSLVYHLLAQLFGPSQVYHTNLELNVLARLFQDVSHKCLQQYSQASLSKKLAKFDYGPEENLAHYGRTRPPEYNVTRVEVHNWVLVEGTADVLADSATVQRLAETSHALRSPVRITAPGFNHLDLLAAVESGRYVNLPILEQLDKHSNFRPV